MVQAIENWADLSGTLRDLRPRPGVENMSELVLHVDRADDVEGFPNFLAETPGRELEVAIRNDALPPEPPPAGTRISLRAQRAAPDVVVAHPAGLSRT
jgi:hypothetical protein